MDELWAVVPGTDGMIEVSNFGNARSYLRNREHGSTIKASCDTAGYPTLRLSLGGVKKNYMVHRYVAQAFIPNPDNKREVNHIDGNKANNHVSNLEWVTHKENLQHAARTGLLENVIKAAWKKNKAIIAVSVKNGEAIEFKSLNAAAEYLGIRGTGGISRAIHGKNRSCAGYCFAFKGGDN